jgi:hypothetical protein
MASKDTTVDAKALMTSIAKGYKLVPTPKVRAGMKKGQQQLVQADGKTLGLLTLREGKGVRVEGQRLSRNLTVTDAKGVTEARKLLEVVTKENLAKLNEATAKKRVAAAKAKQPKASGVQVVQPSGKRARSRSNRARAIA